MILLDINFLIYAHRSDSPHHAQALKKLKELAQTGAPLGLTSFTMVGFLRIVTNHRIFKEPTSFNQAIAFIDTIFNLPQAHRLEPQERYWDILKAAIRDTASTANLISDAHLATVATEHGASILTMDADFRRFKGINVLKWS
ncbi:MAG: PIN domain-containing protein [Deltaproteobacteria bacterium]|nr:PIN domain-containing protein [Deltaproteobacteria bacterium]